MTDLAELERRLSEATGADVALDDALHKALRPCLFDSGCDIDAIYDALGPKAFNYWAFCRPYTASIDSALALVEEKLPGVFWLVGKGKCSASEPLFGAQLLFGDEVIGEGESNSPALALLIALIRALIEKEGADG